MKPRLHEFHLTRHFQATPEQVFDAWLVPRTLGRWAFGHALGCGSLDRLNLDPRKGGQLSLQLRQPHGAVRLSGSYQEIQRPQQLSFVLAADQAEASPQRIHLHLVASDDGCTLNLHHSAAVPACNPARLQADWAVLLDSLSTLFPFPNLEPLP